MPRRAAVRAGRASKRSSSNGASVTSGAPAPLARHHVAAARSARPWRAFIGGCARHSGPRPANPGARHLCALASSRAWWWWSLAAGRRVRSPSLPAPGPFRGCLAGRTPPASPRGPAVGAGSSAPVRRLPASTRRRGHPRTWERWRPATETETAPAPARALTR